MSNDAKIAAVGAIVELCYENATNSAIVGKIGGCAQIIRLIKDHEHHNRIVAESLRAYTMRLKALCVCV